MKNIQIIPSLTPLRGIAATLIIFYHYHMFIGPLSGPGNLLISKFYLMVDLFFILSGFVMAHVYGHWFDQKVERKSFSIFMKARFARIYPLHLFSFLYLLILTVYLKSQLDFQQTPAYIQGIFDNSSIPGVLTMTHAWGTHMEATWNTPSWSISVEWFLYMLFPGLAWVFYKFRAKARILLGLAAFAFLFILSYIIEPAWIEELTMKRQFTEEQLLSHPRNTIDVITGFALIRGLASFVFGMITYELYQRGAVKRVLQKAYCFIIIWGGLVVVWFKDILPDPFVILVFALLILQAAYAEGRVKKVLNCKVFSYLGDISYSIYMVHIPLILTVYIISMINGQMSKPSGEINYAQNWIGATILMAAVLIIASLTYRFIEKPARRMLRKF